MEGDEYCVVCRRYRWEHLKAYWQQKEDLTVCALQCRMDRACYSRGAALHGTHTPHRRMAQRTRAKQRRSKHEAEEKRRKEAFAKLERVWASGKEVYRRNNMSDAKRAKVEKKWKRDVRREYTRRDRFQRDRAREAQEEVTRNEMWDVEQEQREAKEASRRKAEENQLKLQEHLRKVYLQLMSDCKGLQRLKRVS